MSIKGINNVCFVFGQVRLNGRVSVHRTTCNVATCNVQKQMAINAPLLGVLWIVYLFDAIWFCNILNICIDRGSVGGPCFCVSQLHILSETSSLIYVLLTFSRTMPLCPYTGHFQVK